MLTVKPVYKLSNVPDDLKWATNIHMTLFTLTFKAYLTISMLLKEIFAPSFFCLSTNISTRPYLFLPVQMTGGRVST